LVCHTPGTRAKRIGLLHGIGNAEVLLLFVGSAGLALLTAWLGGELVERLGVGVDTRQRLNAPSSL